MPRERCDICSTCFSARVVDCRHLRQRTDHAGHPAVRRAEEWVSQGIQRGGLQARGLSNAALRGIRGIRAADRIMRDYRVVSTALAEIEGELGDVPEVQEIIAFIRSSRRGI